MAKKLKEMNENSDKEGDMLGRSGAEGNTAAFHMNNPWKSQCKLLSLDFCTELLILWNFTMLMCYGSLWVLAR